MSGSEASDPAEPDAAPPDGGSAAPSERRAAVLAALTRWRRPVAAAALLVVVLLVAIAVDRLAREVHYRDVLDALDATPATAVLAAVLATAVSFVALTVYDRCALAHVGRPLPGGVVTLTAFCAYAVGNTAGFGPLTAGAVRYRFYTRLGLEPEEVAAIVAYVTCAFGVGLAAVAAVGLLVAAGDVAPLVGLPAPAMRAAGGAPLVALAGLALVAGRGEGRLGRGRWSIRLPSPPVLAAQFVATGIEVSAAAAALWFLLPPSGIGLPGFVAIYAVAVGLGVLSHLPAGIGVFETVILGTLAGRVPTDAIIGALLLYRLVYYVLPLVAAAMTIGLVEARLAAGATATRLARTAARLAPPVLATLTFVLGAMLVFSGVTPAPHADLAALGAVMPLPIVEGAHFLASILGVGMLVIARGLAFRLDGAWWAAIGASGVGVVLAVCKGLDLEEAIVLLVLLAALLATRRRFGRRASLVAEHLTPPWLVAIATVVAASLVILLVTYRHVEYTQELWWQFELTAAAPRSLRAMLAVSLAAGAVALWSLLRPAPGRVAPPTRAELDRAIAIVADQPCPDANLVRTGDKSLMFSADGRAFVMFGRRGRSWISLLGPIGPRDAWPALVWRFVETAREHGGRAAFYQVAPDSLALYADAGLSAFKLGEAAIVDLATFDLCGSARAGLRQAVSRGTRDGLTFTILEPSSVTASLPALRHVSDQWLASLATREKGFSLGRFDAGYVASQPVAMVARDGVAVAFATLLTTRCAEEASLDLMRVVPDAPAVTMEFLMVHLLQHFAAAGVRRFDLGMAPLSGFSESPAAPVWHRLGRAAFEHGERFYNFRGVRAFKAKFRPTWQPRYLAVAGGLAPALALADSAMLIGGGLAGVVRK